MKELKGYWRTVKGYLTTHKGRHDFFDYLRAFLLICFTIFAVYAVIFWLWGM